MGSDGRIAAVAWLGSALASDQVVNRCCCAAAVAQGRCSSASRCLHDLCQCQSASRQLELPQGAKSLDVGARTASFAAADKSGGVREAGNALIKQMLEVGPVSCAALPGLLALTVSVHRWSLFSTRLPGDAALKPG